MEPMCEGCVKLVGLVSMCRNVFTYKVKFLAYDTVTTGGGLHKEALEYAG